MAIRTRKRFVRGVSKDRISDLPRNVVDDIFKYLLPMDAVKMSLVSKKWRQFWLTLPHLTFSAQFWDNLLAGENSNYMMFHYIVSARLFNHIGPIVKFHLCIPDHVSAANPSISGWIFFVSKNGIKDLAMENWHRVTANLPSVLFSCQDLVRLNLNCFKFHLPPSFKGFPNLVCLELENITFMNDIFESFVSNCPRLEVLKLANWIGLEAISIKAPQLKSLSISGSFLRYVSLCNVSNLVSFSITFKESVDDPCRFATFDMIETLANSCKLEKLHFGDLFWKFLGACGILEMLPTTFSYLRNLELSFIDLNDLDEASCAVGIIRSCPNILELRISVATNTDAADHDFKYYSHNFVLHKLHKANLRHIRGSKPQLKLIECLLTSSPVLEELLVEYDQGLKSTGIIKLSTQLNRFCRPSTRTKLILKGPKD